MARLALNLVSGITDFTKRATVKELFEQFGEVTTLWMPPVGHRGRNQEPPYVKFRRTSAAEAAYEACAAGLLVHWDRKLRAEWRSEHATQSTKWGDNKEFDAKGGGNFITARDMYLESLRSGKGKTRASKQLRGGTSSSSSSSSSKSRARGRKKKHDKKEDDKRRLALEDEGSKKRDRSRNKSQKRDSPPRDRADRDRNDRSRSKRRSRSRSRRDDRRGGDRRGPDRDKRRRSLSPEAALNAAIEKDKEQRELMTVMKARAKGAARPSPGRRSRSQGGGGRSRSPRGRRSRSASNHRKGSGMAVLD